MTCVYDMQRILEVDKDEGPLCRCRFMVEDLITAPFDVTDLVKFFFLVSLPPTSPKSNLR